MRWLGLLAFLACSALQADTVTLKDGQAVSGQIQGYDQYFLDVKSSNGHLFHLPWAEVGAVSRTAGADGEWDNWLQATFISDTPAEVGTIVTPKDPSAAFKASLWPGVLIHGMGHREAGDTDRFYALLGAESFGLLVGAFGAAELFADAKPGETKSTAQILTWSGVGMFTLSWAWDMAFSYSAAERFNKDRGLSLAPGQALDGAVFSFYQRF
jgi:hypothetical protein